MIGALHWLTGAEGPESRTPGYLLAAFAEKGNDLHRIKGVITCHLFYAAGSKTARLF